MKSLRTICVLLLCCIISYSLGDNEKVEEPVVVLQRNVSNTNGLIYTHVYHPQYKQDDELIVSYQEIISPTESRASGEYFSLDGSRGIYQLQSQLLASHEDTDKYCTMIANTNRTWIGTTCQSKLNWMFDRKDILGKFTIPSLVIPGTHQSAAYSSQSPNAFVKQLTKRWAICQSRSITKQLTDGIRFLDLRPAIDIVKGETVYMLHHDAIELMYMSDAVKQINDFMDTSEDIVIVSFKEFPKGFKTIDDHINFQKYLEKVFAKHAHPYTGWSTTLNSFWTSNKRLILSYTYRELLPTDSNLIWPTIHQVYANAQDVPALQSHFARIYENSPTWRDGSRPPHAAMAELTHTVETVGGDIGITALVNLVAPSASTIKSRSSLRDWADLVAPHIFYWFTGKWSQLANIIAVDFYEGSGVVDLAIQLNINRARVV